MIGSRQRWALLVENRDADDKPLEYHVRNLDLDKLDLILVEGFKPEVIPKIELHRPSLGHNLLYPDDESIIAIATDAGLSEDTELPLLNLNDPQQIAQFIIDRYNLTRGQI